MGGTKETVSRRELNDRFGRGDLNQEAEPPDEGAHIWEWFWNLSGKRIQGMDGPQPLTYPDIEAWSRATGTIVLREEIAILMQMDDAYLSAVAEEHKAQRAYAENTTGGKNKSNG